MRFILLWLVGASFYLISFLRLDSLTTSIIAPLLFCSMSIFILRAIPIRSIKTFLAYIFFFSTSVLSFFDFITPLTGSIRESNNVLLFGFSFYSVSLAYIANKSEKPDILSSFKIANPLLLSTGPIAIFIKNYSYRGLSSRVNYYLPFVIVGIFLYQTVGAPLVTAFELIKLTDLVSSVLFAIIFELFVYANFCGLSLILYGLFGIAGYKIPLNFRQPFSSTNIIEFWRGWHLSLSAVLKSLFYLPLRK